MQLSLVDVQGDRRSAGIDSGKEHVSLFHRQLRKDRRFVEKQVARHRLRRHVAGSAEIGEVADDGLDPRQPLPEESGVLREIGGIRFQVVDTGGHPGDGVVHLVRHPGHELPHGGQLLRLDEMRHRLPALFFAPSQPPEHLREALLQKADFVTPFPGDIGPERLRIDRSHYGGKPLKGTGEVRPDHVENDRAEDKENHRERYDPMCKLLELHRKRGGRDADPQGAPALPMDAEGDRHLENAPAVSPSGRNFAAVVAQGENRYGQRVVVDFSVFGVAVVGKDLSLVVGDEGIDSREVAVFQDLFDEVVEKPPLGDYPHILVQQCVDDRGGEGGHHRLSFPLQVLVEEALLVLPEPCAPQGGGDRDDQRRQESEAGPDAEAHSCHRWHPVPHPLGISRMRRKISL